jgi:hypothetical protein
MKTTEMFIEQVIIGAAVLFTGWFLIEPESLHTLWDADFGEVALLGAGVYLIGMFYDRFSDTLLQDAEQHNRLLHGLSAYYGRPVTGDPFPEATWRARLWFTHEAATEYGTYLRSRMRLTRAVTTLIPAFSVAAALWLAKAAHMPVTVPPEAQLAIELVVLAAYLIPFLIKLRRREPLTVAGYAQDPKADYELPRTTHLLNDGIRTWYERLIGGYDRARRRPVHRLATILFLHDPATWAALVLAVTAGVIAFVYQTREGGVAIAVALPLATVLCGWAWWRITETFYTFLVDHDRNAPAP